MVLRRRLDLSALDALRVVEERPHDDVRGGEDGPEPAGADVLLDAGGTRRRAVVRTQDLGEHTSVCDGTERHTTTVVTSLVPA